MKVFQASVKNLPASKPIRFLWIFALAVFFSACATHPKYSITNLQSGLGTTKMLIMPLEVELYEISVGGVPELKGEWTANGKRNLDAATREFLVKSQENLKIINYSSSTNETEAHHQLFRLFNVVGEAILQHYYIPINALPSKKEFSWSLGNTTKVLHDEYGADYALFLRMTDQFSSGGRLALGLVTAVLFGVAPPSGIQTGFAYLVDLRSGEVVWFNFRRSGGFGDIRESESAKDAVKTLLSEFPK